ncbi:serine hydrolase domain-containing protein [Inquilinus sp.]|uniref:serine hydrolase domain-containing protein n=1 Tax=Inquilinus sp. TaxID=1932117 RepID=UPI0031D20011
MDARALAAGLEEFIAHEVGDKAIPSISYAVVDRDALLATGHVVRPDLGHRLDDRSLFRIGSLTKMFTAIGIMQLAERGLVDIDADVSAYIPGFHPVNPFAGRESGPHGPQVSLRKLMSHTAGLVREPKDGHYLDDRRKRLEVTVEGLKTSVLKEDPSAGIMHYSNAGIAVVGWVLEQVSGLLYADYVTRHILAPLGMADSSATLVPEMRDRLAPAWMWDFDRDFPAPVFDLGGSPAGAIFSTAPDMAKFAICMLRGGFAPDGRSILSPASLREMWTVVGKRPAGHSSSQKGYGLCFGVGEVDGWLSVGHGGAVYGYSTQMAALPHAGLAALTFSTLDFSNQIGDRLAKRALQLALAQRRMGRPPAPAAKHPALTAAHRAAMPGVYQSADGEESVELREKDGRLYLMGEGVPLELKWRGGDAFTIDGRIYGEGADYPHLDLTFNGDGVLGWKGKEWTRRNAVQSDVPPGLAPHLGVYGPDFNPTHLFYADGRLKCLIEYFCTHDCEQLPDGSWRMHGILYEGETLELAARDEEGRSGIRVGPMFLVRHADGTTA